MAKQQSAWAQSIPMKEQWKIMGRLMTYTKPYKRQFGGALVAAALLAGMNVALPWLLQYYLDHFLAKQSATLGVIIAVASLYLFGTIIKALLQFMQSFWFMMGSERGLEDVRRELFAKLHTLGMRYFDQTPAGSIVSRVTNDTMTLADFWNVILSVIVGVFSVVSSFIAMVLAAPKIAWTVLLFLPVLIIVIWYYSTYSSKVYRRMRERLSELNTKLNESIEGISIIQQFRQETRITKEFETTNDAYLATRKAMIRTNSLLLSPIINLLYILALVVVLGQFGDNSMHTFVEAGLVYAFTTYVANFFNPMTNMMDSLAFMQDGVVAGSRIFRILDDQELAPTQNPDAHATMTHGKIEFRHVNFSYDGEHNILKDISFVANPGQTVALVGHTGSGKSSIINVLMRFYEFGEGQILIDDQDIRDFSMEELREKLGLVLQDAFMFYGDVASNIRLFNDKITDNQIREAAEFVQADEFIEKLPGQYHARVIEGGSQFSAGQRQLISFARTVVTNPKVLVLDEATANIDTETEAMIQTGLARLRENRTTIAIAHRLSTIQDADLILVLDDGRIVERGTHQELLAQNGRYALMYQLQAGEK
ncbi:ABC transporter ATP-binding protein [Lacticaseibacillus saniviri]|uniref:ABC-type multidrug transport system, ATPase and permease component n=1 Tax=Lacticaseibacillus saniviri JCM 17471 = DSM 24301 TaxID=1293598 RepID=A0A0R2N3J4_9LACO|nr:ABC transporter ATP-binding protein [Lacticaseibacillus saniviri]KRO18621.1 ABC-type multidrug transport system, ATPase and permease component [Lacticaseibacillus saniviri JCM 17471 = DSM 24301]MCG4282216.1 ABC transporter ATP-binding protein/permease [Lacticaseibacillus saniviri]